MRGERREYEAGRARGEHRATGRERVGGGSERRRADEAVAGEADEALAVELDLDDDLAGAGAHQHQVVDREQRAALALDGDGRQPALGPVTRRDALERLAQPLGGHRGERAQAAARDAEHRAAERRGGAQRRECRAVAAEGDDEVAGLHLPRRSHLLVLAGRNDLHDLDALTPRPGPHRLERAPELAAGMDDETDPAGPRPLHATSMTGSTSTSTFSVLAT